MTAKDKKEIAEMTARILAEMQDEMLPMKEVSRRYGVSLSTLYHRWEELGGVKSLGKVFFSRNNFNMLLRQGIV